MKAQHVPLRQSAEGISLGKGREIDENEWSEGVEWRVTWIGRGEWKFLFSVFSFLWQDLVFSVFLFLSFFLLLRVSERTTHGWLTPHNFLKNTKYPSVTGPRHGSRTGVLQYLTSLSVLKFISYWWNSEQYIWNFRSVVVKQNSSVVVKQNSS